MSFDFTRTQQVALAVIPKITSTLSIIGSSWIVIEVATLKSKRQNVYNRLLCIMSVFDIATTAGMFASTWPIPTGTPNVAFAVGNQATCETQGFFLQLGITPFLYNTCLAVYYLLVIKYNVSEERMRRNIEPVMHIFAIGFGLLTSLSALFMDLYNNADLWCWIATYPKNCVDDECIRGRDDFETFRWAFFFVPLWICALFITIIMAVIYRTVRHREIQTEAFSHNHGEFNGRCSIIQPSRPKNTTQKSFFLGNNSRFRNSISPGDQKRAATNTEYKEGIDQEISTNPMRRHPTRNNAKPSMRAVIMTGHQQPSMLIPKHLAEMFQSKTQLKANEEDDAAFVLKAIEGLPSAKEQAAEISSFGSRAVLMQALYYTCGFYITYTFASVNRLVQQGTGKAYFPIIFLHAMLIPLQGLFNFIVYRYYYFNRLKQRYPHMSFSELMKWTCRWTFMGPPPEPRTSTESGNSLSEVSKLRRLFDLSGQSRDKRSGQLERPDTENENLPDTRFDGEAEDGNSPSLRSDDSEIVENCDHPNIVIDDVMGQDNDDYLMELRADLLMSYGDFPNTLAEEPVLVTAKYPTMIGCDSYSDMPTAGITLMSPNDCTQMIEGET